ncbi:hypothetical protein D5R40_30040 [Okeania hirsuta]|uniref:Uncharacterized protein n=1 Tax=Okeania hirsuta TaxID=1458930 RepID=A0A3N6R1U4_9CYAN|nr:hypothetical protein [Okeania hirsuta]RQH24193.1 hypothetical protein D5R40_30040 [Okeania hirsuta]
MKAIQEDMRSKRREIFESSEGDREAMREEMMKLQSSADEQVKGILTVEHWDTIRSLFERKRERRKRVRRRRKAPRKKKEKETDTP